MPFQSALGTLAALLLVCSLFRPVHAAIHHNTIIAATSSSFQLNGDWLDSELNTFWIVQDGSRIGLSYKGRAYTGVFEANDVFVVSRPLLGSEAADLPSYAQRQVEGLGIRVYISGTVSSDGNVITLEVKKLQSVALDTNNNVSLVSFATSTVTCRRKVSIPTTPTAPATQSGISIAKAPGFVAALSGSVLDARGAPAPGLAVKVSRGLSIIAHTTTDANGKFSFPTLPIDTYTVSAETSGHILAVEEGVTILPGHRELLNFRVRSVSTSGHSASSGGKIAVQAKQRASRPIASSQPTAPGRMTQGPSKRQVAAIAGALSRSHAAEVIRSDPKFEYTLRVFVPVGRFILDDRNTSYSLRLFPIKELQAENLLSVSKSGQVENWTPITEYLSELTPRGSDVSRAWSLCARTTQMSVMNANILGPGAVDMGGGLEGFMAPKRSCPSAGSTRVGRLIPVDLSIYSAIVARREMKGVTGIMMLPGGVNARVEFEWAWKPVDKAFASLVPSERHSEAASFTLYDDGWRSRPIEIAPSVNQPLYEFTH